MPWTKPDFQEITLNMEVTAYVNTDDEVRKSAKSPKPTFAEENQSMKNEERGIRN
jgi:coenzyme PQQ precursor peptide PqqA